MKITSVNNRMVMKQYFQEAYSLGGDSVTDYLVGISLKALLG